MTNEACSLNVRILKNGTIVKVINEPVKFEPQWGTYQQTLRNIQKTVNTHLTELVEQQSTDSETRMDTDAVDEEDESDTERTLTKRKLESKHCINKKIKS